MLFNKIKIFLNFCIPQPRPLPKLLHSRKYLRFGTSAPQSRQPLLRFSSVSQWAKQNGRRNDQSCESTDFSNITTFPLESWPLLELGNNKNKVPSDTKLTKKKLFFLSKMSCFVRSCGNPGVKNHQRLQITRHWHCDFDYF